MAGSVPLARNLIIEAAERDAKSLRGANNGWFPPKGNLVITCNQYIVTLYNGWFPPKGNLVIICSQYIVTIYNNGWFPPKVHCRGTA